MKINRSSMTSGHQRRTIERMMTRVDVAGTDDHLVNLHVAVMTMMIEAVVGVEEDEMMTIVMVMGAQDGGLVAEMRIHGLVGAVEITMIPEVAVVNVVIENDAEGRI